MKPALYSFLQQNRKTVRDIPDLNFCKYCKKSIPLFEPMCLEPGGGFNRLDHVVVLYIIIIGKESCLESVGLLTVVGQS